MGQLKCIACDKDAEYMYLGNSYCEEHKNEHQEKVKAAIEEAEKKK